MAKTNGNGKDKAEQAARHEAPEAPAQEPTIQEQADSVLSGDAVSVDHGQGSAADLREQADAQDAAREEATGEREASSGSKTSATKKA